MTEKVSLSVKNNDKVNKENGAEPMDFEIAEIKKTFDKFAVNNLLPKEQLGNAMRWLKITPTNYEIEKIKKQLHTEHTDYLTQIEFVNMINRVWIPDPVIREREYWEAFLVFDVEEKGIMTPEKLRFILLEVGAEPLTPKEVEKIIRTSINNDGMIEYGNLIRLWQH